MRFSAVLALAALALLAPAEVEAAPWTVDRIASRIELSVQALGGSHRGRFNEWIGDIVFDPAHPDSTRALIIVQSSSLVMSPAAISRRATGPAFLDAVRYPQIRFDLRALEPIEGDRYTARALVTIKGVARPVSFPVDLRISGERAHLTGAFVVNRVDFGIGTSGPWNRLVGQQVTVRVALQAGRG